MSLHQTRVRPGGHHHEEEWKMQCLGIILATRRARVSTVAVIMFLPSVSNCVVATSTHLTAGDDAYCIGFGMDRMM